MRVLVTGALGFVGINCVRELAQQGHDVLALTRREPDEESQHYVADVSGTVNWLLGDVTDSDRLHDLIQQHKPSHVLHAAALTGSPRLEYDNPNQMLEVNVMGSAYLLDAARKAGVKRMVVMSSGGVYGTAPAYPVVSEDSPLHIGNLYTICKQSIEALCRRYNQLYDMEVVVGRLGTAYGPMERASGSRHNLSAITQVMMAARESAEMLMVHGAAIERDFCHVWDVASAYRALLESEELRHQLYNVGTDEALPLSSALNTLKKHVTGFDWQEAPAEQAALSQQPHQARPAMNLGRLKQDTTWQPAYTLDTGLIHSYDWWQSWSAQQEAQDHA